MNLLARRKDFQVLIVDRDDERRAVLLEMLLELGFGGVQVASAPDSAASYADMQPPHIALVASHPEAEARTTVLKLRSISREIQIVLLVSEASKDAVLKAREFASSLNKGEESTIWDVLTLPPPLQNRNEARTALELVVDRAGARLFYQFESEHWQERWRKLGPKDGRDPAAVRDRLYASTKEFAKVRDLDATIAAATRAFSRLTDGKPVVYLKWVSIRGAFVISHHFDGKATGGKTLDKIKGLGFAIADTASLGNLGEIPELKEFARDVFAADVCTGLLHGTPAEPEGLFVLLETKLHAAIVDELEAMSFLFDLTWSRMEALRDRHALERIDRASGLPNKKALRENLDFECTRARRLRHALSAASVEIGAAGGGDIESKLGPAYEAVMKVVGQTLRRALRGTDYVARVERRRLIVLMPHTSVTEAVGVIDRMCRLLERLQLPALEAAKVPRLKVRAGLAEYPRLSADADGLLQALDDASTAAWAAPDSSAHRVMVFEVPAGFEPDFLPVGNPMVGELESGDPA